MTCAITLPAQAASPPAPGGHPGTHASAPARSPLRRATLAAGALALGASLTESLQVWLAHASWPRHDALPWVIILMLPAWVLLAALTPFVAWMVRRFPLAGRMDAAGWAAHAAAGPLFALAHLGALTAVQSLSRGGLDPAANLTLLLGEYFLRDVVTYWAIAGTLHAMGYGAAPARADARAAALTPAMTALPAAPCVRSVSVQSVTTTPPVPPGSTSPSAPAVPAPYISRFLVKGVSRTELVPATSVRWIEGASYYVRLHTGARPHLLRESLGSLERRLHPAHWVRVHRSAIVNLERVREVRGEPSGPVVVLDDGTRVPVSRSRRSAFAALLRERAGRES